MTNLDSILKNRDITLLTKFHIVKDMVFPVAIHGCESWTIKKTEHQRIDALQLWCWRRLSYSRRSNQSLEGLILKQKLQNFIHMMQRTDSLENALMLGKIEGRRRRRQQSMRWLDGITDLME